MFTQDDLIDLLMSHLAPRKAAQAPRKGAFPEARGRTFVTEYEIKKRLTGGARSLTLPKDAIVSPLAVDWLILNSIEIIRE